MRKFLPLLILLLSWPATAKPLAWLSYDQGLSTARRQHKLLLVQIYADWCRECHHLSQDFSDNPRLNRLLRQRYVLARVGLDSQQLVTYQGERISEQQLATRLQATWPPMLLFYTADGRLLGRKFGYAPPAEMQSLLEKLAPQI